jgi:hypothetical protein
MALPADAPLASVATRPDAVAEVVMVVFLSF